MECIAVYFNYHRNSIFKYCEVWLNTAGRNTASKHNSQRRKWQSRKLQRIKKENFWL